MPVSRPQYPIRAVARLTGLSVDTLRAWERRYGAVAPGRGDRGRLYSPADVTRLQRLAALVDRGHAIGTIATLSDAALRRLLDANQPAPAERPRADLTRLLAALDRYDVAALDGVLSEYAVLLPPAELIFAVILPLMHEMGERWAAGTLRPAQEHLVSAIVRSVLGGLLRAMARPQAATQIICAAPSGERHELGLLCAGVLAAANGFGVVYLGADLPARDIVTAATKASAAIAVIGLTLPQAVTRRELAALDELPSTTELWVGGAAARDAHGVLGGRAHTVPNLQEYAAQLAARGGKG